MIDWVRKLMRGDGVAASPVAPPAAPPPAPIALDEARLPVRGRELANAIKGLIEQLLHDPSHSQLERAMLAELAMMRDEHLPKLLRSYILIPAEHRKEIFKKSGQSASYLLEESLRNMHAKVEAISRDLAQNDIDAFANNTEFIARRYGRTEDPFS